MMDGYLLNKSIILGSQLYFSGYFSGNFIWFVLTLRRHPQIAGGWGYGICQRLIVDIYASIEWNETMLFAFPLYCHYLHDGMSVYMPILQFVRQNGLNGQFYRLPGYENCTHETLISHLVLHEITQSFLHHLHIAAAYMMVYELKRQFCNLPAKMG